MKLNRKSKSFQKAQEAHGRVDVSESVARQKEDESEISQEKIQNKE
jgi:hypothetical protein